MSHHSETLVTVDPNPVVRAPRSCRSALERGMATVEYALGILLVVTVVGVAVWSAQQGWFRDMVEAVFKLLFQLVTSHLTIP